MAHKFLECGNLERGFARIRCDHCEHEYLLAFSCKRRWFCPFCHQKNAKIILLTTILTTIWLTTLALSGKTGPQ